MATTYENYFQKEIYEPIKNELHQKLKDFLYKKLNEIYPELSACLLSDIYLLDVPKNLYDFFTGLILEYRDDKKIEAILSANNLGDGIAETLNEIREKVAESDFREKVAESDYHSEYHENQKVKKAELPLHLTKLHEFYKIAHDPISESAAAEQLQYSIKKITQDERHELNKDSSFFRRIVNAVSAFIKTHQFTSKALESDALHVLRIVDHKAGRPEALINFDRHEKEALPSVNESSSSPSSNCSL